MNELIKADSLLGLAKELEKINSIDKKRCVDYYLEKKARARGVPFHGTFELTPLCNLDCKMCYIHLDNSEFSDNDLLPTSTWIQLMEEAHKAGMIKATLTGGECLTYPGFDEIYSFLYNKGVDLTVLSNGLLMNDSRIDFFKDHPPRLIQISLYGHSDNSYERITGNRVFSVVKNNILKLSSTKLRLFLMITPSKFMDKDINSIIEFAENLSIPYSINTRLIQPRKNTGRQSNDISIERCIEIYKFQSRLKHVILKPVNLEELPIIESKEERNKGIKCGGGRSAFTIQYNGKMSPCPSLYEISAEPLLVGFNKAWSIINEKVSQYVPPLECRTCPYANVCISCPALHLDSGLIGNCNTQICQLTKRLIQEGLLSLANE